MTCWHINLLTLFPDMFPGYLGQSLSGKALEKKIWSYDAINIRDFAADIGDDDDLVRMFDLEAEYRLRDLSLPEELVAAEQEMMDRAMEEWLETDPESWDEMAESVIDEIADFTCSTAAALKS